MRASTRDRQLATVVQAGNATLQAIAQQEAPLRTAIAQLPGTMRATRSMLADTTKLARASGPALKAFTPAVRRLPVIFHALRPFARSATPVLGRELRPYTVETQPLLRDAAPALAGVSAMTPPFERVFRVLQYWQNEGAYNPPGNDEGGLFWLAWFGHNIDSNFAGGDANGGLGRSTVMVSCSQLNAAGAGFGLVLDKIFKVSDACDRLSRGAGG